MDINKIKFNPYNKQDLDEVIKIFLLTQTSSSTEEAIEELADRIYMDSTFNWKQILTELCERFNLLNVIANHYYTIINDQRADIISQYTYLITILISNNLLPISFLIKEEINKLEFFNEKRDGSIVNDSKYILLSFLASWNLEKALELDNNFVREKFNHLLEAKKAPIKELIINSNNETYFNVLQSLLKDTSIQFHINQTIQKIIRENDCIELDGLETFFSKCFSSTSEYELHFILDTLEMSLVKKFLLERWNIQFTERLYKYFSRNLNVFFMPTIQKRAIYTINKIRKQLTDDYHMAARHEINKLQMSDKDFILEVVNKRSNNEIEDFEFFTFILEKQSWEWNDYANEIVNNYKKLYPEDSTIDLRKLASNLNLEIVVHNFNTEEFDACLVRDSSLVSPIIFVNSRKKSKGRINFSIAHEIAHAVIPHHSKKSFFCFIHDISEGNKVKMDNKLEFEANSFASYILLPDKIFREICSKFNYNIKNVQLLSERFEVSKVLVAKKWVQTTNLEVAMLVSTDGKIDWAFTSDTFPFGWIDVIPKNSAVYKLLDQRELIELKKETYSTSWFNTAFEKLLQEESIVIFENTILTLLQVIED